MFLDTLALGLLWYVVFVLSTTCHEAAHALVAKWGGDLTAFHGGQVTLSPLPHIKREPFGMVVFPILTFFTGGWMMGWASAPYDLDWSQRYPHRAAKMALAGPAANALLALLATLAIHAGLWAGIFVTPESVSFTQIVDPASPGLAEGLAKLLSLMFTLNVLLAVFNLIPVPPLDGFSAVGLLMSENRARRLEELGHAMRNFSYIGLLISWQVFGALYDPLFNLALLILYPGQHYR
jgi:Zn-dependent protease